MRRSPDLFHKKIAALRAQDLAWVKMLPEGMFSYRDAAEAWGVHWKTARTRLNLLRATMMVCWRKKTKRWYVRCRK